MSKARAMSQDWKVIASLLGNGEIALYNADGKNKEPSSVLRGLSDEGFGLSWNPNQKGVLVAATGSTMCLWDTNQVSQKGAPTLKIE